MLICEWLTVKMQIRVLTTLLWPWYADVYQRLSSDDDFSIKALSSFVLSVKMRSWGNDLPNSYALVKAEIQTKGMQKNVK